MLSLLLVSVVAFGRCNVARLLRLLAIYLSHGFPFRLQLSKMAPSVLNPLVLAGLGALALGPLESQSFVLVSSPCNGGVVMNQIHLPPHHRQVMIGHQHHYTTSTTTSRHWCGGARSYDDVGMLAGRSSFLPLRSSSAAEGDSGSKKMRAISAVPAPEMSCLPGGVGKSRVESRDANGELVNGNGDTRYCCTSDITVVVVVVVVVFTLNITRYTPGAAVPTRPKVVLHPNDMPQRSSTASFTSE